MRPGMFLMCCVFVAKYADVVSVDETIEYLSRIKARR
jgi:hypothetical protein